MKGMNMEPKIVTKPSTNQEPKQKVKRKYPRWLIPVGIILLVILVSTAALGVVAYSTGTKLKASLTEAKVHAQAAYDGLKGQNIAIAKTELDAAKAKVDESYQIYNGISFLRFTPFAWHYSDGQHTFNAVTSAVEAGQLVINAIEPYADVIGFTGQGSFVGGTAEDRIVKIVETLDKVNPSLDEVASKLDIINAELAQINPGRYPFITIQGQSVSGLIGMAQEKISQADSMLAQFRPALSVLPQVAGLDAERTYLIMFQNDAELRPTGGFLTAYAVLKVNKGKVSPQKSSDIYDLDDKFKKRVTPPDIIKSELNETTWHLRNMNISPDFKESMETFITYYNDLPGETKVDGVIAVDTKLLADLVEILGPIDVPGYGTFKADLDKRCDCPQVIYALEEIADKPTYTIKTDRKAVLGPLMQTILTKAYGAPKQQWPGLFNSIWRNMNEKHILMYFFNEDFQNAAETVNVAGRIKEYDADYLHINDSNFGGAKSNLFVTQSVEQDIVKNGNEIVKTITISYKNPRKGDNCNLEAGMLCLNGKLPMWTRIYLPKDAVVTEVLGFDNNSVKETEAFNKKVVEGLFELMPESQAKIKLTVKIPAKGDSYRLFIQKQPGTKNFDYIVRLAGHEEEFELVSDKELTLNY